MKVAGCIKGQTPLGLNSLPLRGWLTLMSKTRFPEHTAKPVSVSDPPIEEVRTVIDEAGVPGVTAPMIARQLDGCPECSDNLRGLQEAISRLKAAGEIDGEVTNVGAVVWWST